MKSIPILKYDPKVVVVCPLIHDNPSIHLLIEEQLDWEWIATINTPDNHLTFSMVHRMPMRILDYTVTMDMQRPRKFYKQKVKEPILPLKTRDVWIEDCDMFYMKRQKVVRI